MHAYLDFYLDAGLALSAMVFGTFLLAGTVKGCIGLGLPTVAVGLLSLTMPAPQAAALLVVPSIVTNVWQCVVGGHFAALLRRLAPMLVAICVGNAVGVLWLAGTAVAGAGSLLGCALLLYAVLGLAAVRMQVPPQAEWWLGPLTGAATGLITAATGVFVIPAVPYLQALGLERNTLVQAMGISFMVSTLAMAGGLIYSGALGGAEASASVLAVAPALVGMALGGWLRQRVSEKVFKRGFFIALFLLGGHLLLAG
ncbi:sulfite exporter TauE/SafE family protein [Bordetella genomosp. 1]|uniref:Probable membrane transporter protein n=1 Tax=Bordetella genomosp. 1 TaxID=1395607 RepID=A0ABX4EXU8_9BORD|nr:sulfite exporter TauE/SafE family protein [Bordetella genomosp. 1]OZI58001.1 hypothetical protein CAL27_21700 [Bordetella genomosp. 1]